MKELEKYLKHLVKRYKANWGRISDHSDTEAVHDFRVASRNILSVLKFLSPKQSKSNSECQSLVKEVLKSFGSYRDLQVFTELLPKFRNASDYKEVRAVLKRDLQKSKSTLETQIQKLDRKNALLTQILQQLDTEFSAPLKQAKQTPEEFQEHILNRWKRLKLKTNSEFIRVQSSEPELLHKLRIKIKRLKYVSFFIRELKITADTDLKSEIKTISKYQSRLGEIQDLHSLLNYLNYKDIESSTYKLVNRKLQQKCAKFIKKKGKAPLV